MKKSNYLSLLALLASNFISAQGLLNKSDVAFSRQDSLRGSITKERA